ncbi:hypothetical protein KY290_031284 [Solanum tuberosum]|uniref:DUF3444 domain-containing protein n=1 Tax=Solanum tuberosum TaxID=4113 RepID=A0ABQ7U8N9_SOLTU|nr:hypothetical protein KY290_031284 [Solanum tuberosum]
MDCNKEETIIFEEMMGNRKKTSTESSKNSEVSAHLSRQNFQCLNEENQPRSMRRRQRVNYISDEEDASKRFKGVRYPTPTKESEMQDLSSKESLRNTEMEIETAKGIVDLPSDVGPSTIAVSETFEYKHPDFSDVDKEKEETCFKVGQVWAIYDTLDVMPRFYAVIRKILSPSFKLRIQWLEPEPLNEDETKWLSEGFPGSCGRFRLGNSEDHDDHPMFSHLVCAMTGNIYDEIKIFPLEGETWALFKYWDINWCPHLGSNKNFNYEFVEVLSDYVGAIGVHVAYLNKVKGFTCLFHRAGDPFLVPAKDMFKFSHRIPSMKMTGMEKDGVPEGSLELDPASLPTDRVGISAPSIAQTETTNFMDSINSTKNWVSSVPNQVPEPEFYKFATERSPEKFQIGECWAIRSNEDALLRYYGQIKKIDLLPEFVLHVTAKPVKRGVYKIFPRKGEVWAVYKNWSAQLKCNNLEELEYEIVEIVDVSDNYVDVRFLAWIKGFKSVYKPRVEEEEADGVVKIFVSQHLRFSH